MLKPEYLERVPDSLVTLYARVEADVLADMARRIGAQNYFIPAAEWQMKKLESLGLVREEIIRRLSAITGSTEEELKNVMKASGIESIKSDDEVYRRAGLSPPPLATSMALQRVIETGYQKTLQSFKNLTATTANTAIKQFEDALDRAWLQVTSGAFTQTQAALMAIKSLTEKGMGMIRYPTGHIDYTDVAVRRAVMTGVNQTCGMMQDERAAEMGCDLVEVSAHSGARPSHAEWQGKIYSRSGGSDKYPPFVESTGYGTGPGLCGWNCRHNFYPFFEGLSRPAYSPQELAEMDEPKYEYNGKKMTEYEAVGRQREIERKLRRWKREEQAMKATGFPADEAKAKITHWNGVQKDYLAQTELKRQYDREKIYGNVNFSTQKHYQKNAKSDIIATRNKYKVGTHPVTQKQIDSIVSGELSGIRFSAVPTYNPRIRTSGKTTFLMYPWGEVKGIKSVEIGKQLSSQKGELIDTILHEELEARIFMNPTRKHKELVQIGTDEAIHAHVNKVIERYRRMKGA